VLSKNASWCMDIVDQSSTTSACFTKAYSRYMKGSGSILLVSMDPTVRCHIDSAGVGEKRGLDACEESDCEAVPAVSGGGSSTYLTDPAARTFNVDWRAKFPNSKFRYFAPKELLSIFGFPPSFTFPRHLTNRKCFEMIGNSVNVTVVARIVEYLLYDSSFACVSQ
jgi:site-specific DNA-cytosine methylase